MWAAENPLAALIPYFLMGSSLFLAFIILYFAKLDKISGVTVPRAILILILVRVVDGATFWTAAGGRYAEGELNPLYNIGILTALPHFQAFILSFGISTLISVLCILLFWIFLRLGTSKRKAARMALAFTAVLTVIFMVGAVSNIAWIGLGRSSPLLFR